MFNAWPRMAAATSPPMATNTGNSRRITTITIAPATHATLPEFGVAVAADEMVIHQTARLHDRVADGAADEPEPQPLEVLAHAVRGDRRRRNVAHRGPVVLHRCAVDVAPQQRR